MIIYKRLVPPDDHLQEATTTTTVTGVTRGDGTEGGEEGKGEGEDEILADLRTHGPIKCSTRGPRGPRRVKDEPSKGHHQDFFMTKPKAASSNLKSEILQAK